MRALAVMGIVALRTWRKTVRRPVLLTFSFAQPMLWMLFFGFLFEKFPLREFAGEPRSYRTFLVPGICAMTVLFGASQSGIALIRDMQTRFLSRLLMTPAGRGALLGGKLAADVSRLVLQALAVLVLGILVGGRLDTAAGPFLAGLLALALFTAALSSLSCLIALKTRNPEGMAVFVHLVNMPLLFTSSALVPGRRMPEWLQVVSQWNPLTVAVDAFRGALLEAEWPSGQGLLVLLVLAAILCLLARHALVRAVRQPAGVVS